MRLSLSTNWCNRRIESGEEIADLAMALGFEELELGFHTTVQQAKGFKSRLGQIPVGSIHAFCPVPISAPQGYPELYSLAALDENERAIARVHVKKNIAFAAEMGADAVVLHAGRVGFGTWFDRLDTQKLCERLRACDRHVDDPKYARMLARAAKRRQAQGQKVLDVFVQELSGLVALLEKENVTLALENLPYYEGFPLPDELRTILSNEFGGRVKGWYDTGHARVCEMHGWPSPRPNPASAPSIPDPLAYAGLHLNDVEAFEDDHLPPGKGNVDFAALKGFAESVRHVVFEPNAGVSASDLREGVDYIRKTWNA